MSPKLFSLIFVHPWRWKDPMTTDHNCSLCFVFSRKKSREVFFHTICLRAIDPPPEKEFSWDKGRWVRACGFRVWKEKSLHKDGIFFERFVCVLFLSLHWFGRSVGPSALRLSFSRTVLFTEVFYRGLVLCSRVLRSQPTVCCLMKSCTVKREREGERTRMFVRSVCRIIIHLFWTCLSPFFSSENSDTIQYNTR